jgi:phosphoesterase RecJ-like protein
MKTKSKQLSEKINAAKSIVLIMHNNPDGDALGTALGLAELIRDNFGKNADVIHTGVIPSFLDWMPGRQSVKKSEDITDDFDLAIMTDTSGGNTGDASMAVFNRAHDTAKIDHHETSQDIANLNIDKAVNSTAQIVLEIAQNANWKINADAATCLYAGISSDTGRFQWVDDPSAFIAAADCMVLGANPREIDESLKVSNRNSMIENAKIVVNAEFLFDGKLAISHVAKETYPNLDGKGSSAMEWLRRIDTVEYVALLKETEEGVVHVSLRSKHLPVNTVAVALGGGGHMNAAAVRLNTDLETAKKIILNAFAEIM